MTEAGLQYAQEVYAACATTGFVTGSAAALKALLDRIAAGEDVAEREVLQSAQAAQLAAAHRAGQP